MISEMALTITIIGRRCGASSLPAFAVTPLVKGNASDLHITLPDILSPEESVEVGYFGIGLKSGRKQAYAQIAIEDYVEELKAGQIPEITDMDELRASHEIRVIADGGGEEAEAQAV